jgi:hypothetical protein
MDGIPGLLGQLELDGAPGFLLHDHGTLSDATGHGNITDPQGHQVTTAELAVNGQIKQGQVALLFQDLEPDANSPDLLGFQRGLLAGQFPPMAGHRITGLFGKKIKLGHGDLLPRPAMPNQKKIRWSLRHLCIY